MSRTATKLLSAQGVQVDLGRRRVLDSVDFGLAAGELVGLLGPNGAGKTTLLRALAGLQPLARGDVRLLDRDVHEYADAERARRLAYLPQDGQCHWPMPVAQVVALGRLPHRAPWAALPAADDAAVQRALAATDVAHLASRAVTELSGGERARVLLARALAVEAPVLLADEPVAGLDPAHQLGVMELLKSRALSGAAVVVTLHDLTLASRYCDRLLLLSEGRSMADGIPESVLTAENLRQVYGVEAFYGQTGQGLLVVPLSRR
jgi:iron complex transport system ATP-binding protein